MTLKEQLEAALKEKTDLKEALQQSRLKIEDLEADLQQWNSKIEDLEADLQQSNSKIEVLEDDLRQARLKIEGLEASEDSKESVLSLSKENDKLKKELAIYKLASKEKDIAITSDMVQLKNSK